MPLLLLNLEEHLDLVLRKMEPVVNKNECARHEYECEVTNQVVKHLSEETLQRVVRDQVLDPEEQYESKRLTDREEEGPHVEV